MGSKCALRVLVAGFFVLLLALPVAGLCQPSSKPILHQPLATARYRVIKELQRQLGFFPFYGTLENTPDILFPVGKSDKVYLVLIGTYQKARGYDGDQMLCYELRGTALRFRYSVRIQEVHKSPKTNMPVKSLRDYLSLLGDGFVPYSYRVSGRVSKNAKRDLDLRQDLVQYSLRAALGVLQVQYLDSEQPDSLYGPRQRQLFDVDGDVGSKEEKRWYETYGLPLADIELAAIKARAGSKPRSLRGAAIAAVYYCIKTHDPKGRGRPWVCYIPERLGGRSKLVTGELESGGIRCVDRSWMNGGRRPDRRFYLEITGAKRLSHGRAIVSIYALLDYTPNDPDVYPVDGHLEVYLYDTPEKWVVDEKRSKEQWNE